MIRKSSSKGFSIAGVLIVLVALIVTGIAGWYVYQSHKNTVSTDHVNKQRNDKMVSWETYRNEKTGITFQYPDTWKVETTENKSPHDGGWDAVVGTVTSPEGRKLTWTYSNVGGSGGDCFPEPGNKPFQSGNNCSSKQILSVEKVRELKGNNQSPFFSDHTLFVTRTKYQERGSDTEVKYQICLDPYRDDQEPEPKTVMGLVFPCQFWRLGFNAKFEVKDEQAFNSSDAKTAERIMKTFNTYKNPEPR
jgi:hypothetical protein